jgi:RNA 2',3'-cyclic 3'-phosphodiesterase
VTRADGAPSSLRLFTALWPSPALRAALAALRDRWQWPPAAALVDTDRLHVTLHFIGQVPAALLAELVGGLDLAVEPAELHFDPARQKVWPGGIAVLEFNAPDALRRLHARVGAALVALGLPVDERQWRPHVTFARKAQRAQPPSDAPALPSWQVDGYALVRSVPGGRYDTLQHYPRKG